MKYFIFMVMVIVFVTVFLGCQDALSPEAENGSTLPMIESTIETDPPDCDACVRSPGYWKNHPEEWPNDNDGWYKDWFDHLGLTKVDMQEIMGMKGMNKDKWYTMFKAVVAAKLDLEILGSAHCKSEVLNACICQVANAGFAWLHEHGHTEGVKANSKCWQKKGEEIYLVLDAYYNGNLCEEAKPCD